MMFNALRSANKARRIYNSFCPTCKRNIVKHIQKTQDRQEAINQTRTLLCDKCRQIYEGEL